MRPCYGILALTVGCSAAEPSAELVNMPACHDDIAPGEVQVFAAGFAVAGLVGTEGLAFSPDGRLFVGGAGFADGGFVAEIQPDGSWDVITDLPASVGMVWHDARLLVASGDVGDGTPGLVALDVDTGALEVVARGMGGANFPAITPWNTVLVSSPDGTTVWEVDDGAVSIWAEDVPSPNGIAFAPDGRTVYIANTYTSPSTVSALDVSGGHAGPVRVHATFLDGSTQDGVAIDAAGNLYVVNNLPGTIARVTPDGEWEDVAEGVTYGASLGFGTGAFDPCSLYVSSLFSEDVFRVGVTLP